MRRLPPRGGTSAQRSPKEMAIRLLPATGAVLAVLGAGDIVLGEDSMANKAMDTLGMGAGTAFGYHRGKVGGTTPQGRALRMAGYAGAGDVSMDLIQLLGGME